MSREWIAKRLAERNAKQAEIAAEVERKEQEKLAELVFNSAQKLSGQIDNLLTDENMSSEEIEASVEEFVEGQGLTETALAFVEALVDLGGEKITLPHALAIVQGKQIGRGPRIAILAQIAALVAACQAAGVVGSYGNTRALYAACGRPHGVKLNSIHARYDAVVAGFADAGFVFKAEKVSALTDRETDRQFSGAVTISEA